MVTHLHMKLSDCISVLHEALQEKAITAVPDPDP